MRAILRQHIDIKRISYRDTQSYMGILIDDSNRKPVCRLHFNGKKKSLTLFDSDSGERIDISMLDDIYQLSERLLNAAYRHVQVEVPAKN